MEDLNDKITGGVLTAGQWNQVPSELQNVIEGTGQTLTNADLNQVGKGVADYVANSNFYTDSGVADAYVLTSIGSKQSLTAYVDGMAVEFLPGNTNTGASTINVATLGLKTITGAAAGDIVSGLRIVLKFRSGADDFVIDGGGDVVEEVNNVITGTGQTPDDVDQDQLGKGIAEYSANGDFYTDSGAADVYVLTVIGSKQGPVAYVDGMRVRFIADNTNTLATATVNVAGLGVKNVVSLTAGDFSTSIGNTITYRTGSGDFILTSVSVAAGSIGQDEINATELNPIVQTVENTINTYVANVSTIIPLDDTIPQNTEGVEILTATITPKNSSNLLDIIFHANVGSVSGGVNYSIALFKDSIANALETVGGLGANDTALNTTTLRHRIVAGSTSAIVFKMRAGPSGASDIHINGNDSGSRYGTSSVTSITILEILQP